VGILHPVHVHNTTNETLIIMAGAGDHVENEQRDGECIRKMSFICQNQKSSGAPNTRRKPASGPGVKRMCIYYLYIENPSNIKLTLCIVNNIYIYIHVRINIISEREKNGRFVLHEYTFNIRPRKCARSFCS